MVNSKLITTLFIALSIFGTMVANAAPTELGLTVKHTDSGEVHVSVQLAQHNADLDMPDRFGNTALHYACLACLPICPACWPSQPAQPNLHTSSLPSLPRQRCYMACLPV